VTVIGSPVCLHLRRSGRLVPCPTMVQYRVHDIAGLNPKWTVCLLVTKHCHNTAFGKAVPLSAVTIR